MQIADLSHFLLLLAQMVGCENRIRLLYRIYALSPVQGALPVTSVDDPDPCCL